MTFDNNNTKSVKEITEWLKQQARNKVKMARFSRDSNRNVVKRDFRAYSKPPAFPPQGPSMQATLGLYPKTQERFFIDMSEAAPVTRQQGARF